MEQKKGAGEAGQRLFDRTYELVFGGSKDGVGFKIEGNEREGTGLELSFKIRKFLHNKTDPNIAEIEITNISDEILNRIQKECQMVSLSVGYGGNNVLLFTGNILEIEPKQGSEVDKVTKMTCTPSSGALYTPSVNKTFPPGSTVKSVLNYIVKNDSSLVQSSYNSISIDQKFPFGYTVHGTAKQVLDDLSSEFNFTYRIDQNRLMISDYDKCQSKNSEGNAFLLTWDSGLKESPVYASADGKTVSLKPSKKHSTKEKLKQKQSGVKCKAFLNPLLNPGTAIKIEGTRMDGVYRINGAEFTGEWRSSGTWDVELYCTKLG